ncbi:MAG: hypothetical protein EOP83_33710 [Verrucomicrobiaceae bacterium]|nr:MAG: hypothetical protein EOP83_33710 [Verrucomicrobiaceae bacterium]
MSVEVREFYDEDNDDWIFTVDPSASSSLRHGVDEANEAFAEIRTWCLEHFGPPSKTDETRWYASHHRAFSIPNPAQAFEFKMRWVTSN